MIQNLSKHKIIIAIFVMLIIIVLGYFFVKELNLVIRIFLESTLTYVVIWTITVFIYSLFYYYAKKKKYNLKTYFGDFYETIIGGIGIATGLVSAIKLLKGFFIQKVFNESYFTHFEEYDFWSILITILFLCFFLVMKVSNTVKELIWLSRIEGVIEE